MPQAIYCLAAVVLLGLYSINRHTSQAEDENELIEREIESAALQVAERWAARIKDRAFDEADLAASEPRIDDATGLTAPDSLGVTRLSEIVDELPAHGTDYVRFDDVDDFDAIAGADTLWIGPNGTRALPFTVEIDVQYIHPDTFAPSSVATVAKEAEIRVTEVGAASRPPVRVTLPVQTSSARQFLHN